MVQRSKRVRAIGGIFFRSRDPAKTREWYQRHLGLQTDSTGTNFAWRRADESSRFGFSQWAPFPEDTAYFGASDQQFMVNYRVDDLDTLLAGLRAEGVTIVGDVQLTPYGKFAHVVDIDGRRVELWEPVDSQYEKILDGVTK